MTSRVVVGYTATKAGRDALALGSRLARATGSELHTVVILPADSRSVVTPPDAAYDGYLEEQAGRWLAEAGERVPEEVSRTPHVRFAESVGEGLIAVADELDAAYIVVGTANGAGRGRYRLGTTANELLHTSDVPVVLAPRGTRKHEVDGIPRLTVAVGTRPGAGDLLDEAVALAAATGASLRLVSLVTVDLPATVDTGVIRLAGAAHADDVLATAQDALRAESPGVETTAEVARGDGIEEAVAALEWMPGELALVGSSRLAQPRRLFLGSTAARMMRALPVPMVVVPRARVRDGVRGDDEGGKQA